MIRILKCLGAVAAVLLALAQPAAAVPQVIASILPVQSIVAAVMGKLGSPELLFQGRLSEHTASLMPRQIAELGAADLVFMVSHRLEYKLGEIDGSEAVNGRRFIELDEAPGVHHLAIRAGAAWEPDDDEPAPAAATGASALLLTADPHIWLDPENAAAMARAAAGALAAADPANAATYRANAEAFAASLQGLSREIAAQLAPVHGKPFIVFHDAYHYFEKRFGLSAAGSISDVSAAAPSAARLKQIRDRIVEAGAVCVFREPQFDDRYVRAVIEGTPAAEAVLDGLGADLAPGPDAYGALLRNLAAGFRRCLSP